MIKLKNKNKYKGMTFVETVVTIAIMAIVMLGSSLFFVRMWTSHHFAIKSGIASLVATVSVEQAVGLIRKAQQAQNGAFPIAVADDYEFTFYSDYDNDNVVEKIRLFVDEDTFNMGIVEPDISGIIATYDDTTEVTKTIANNVTNGIDSGDPVFEYYDVDGKIYTYSDIEGKALETLAIPAEVRMVKVTLMINPEPILRSPDDVEIQSFVVIRNLTQYDELPT
jgi:hypothetical protein